MPLSKYSLKASRHSLVPNSAVESDVWLTLRAHALARLAADVRDRLKSCLEYFLVVSRRSPCVTSFLFC